MTTKHKFIRFIGTMIGVVIGWKMHEYATNIFLNLTAGMDRQSFFWLALLVALPWIWLAFTFAAAIEKMVTAALMRVDAFVLEK